MGGVGQVGYGPLWRIDGPLPLPPVYSLLNTARVISDADSGGVERWINGVTVYPYPTDAAGVWDACAQGSEAVDKADGGSVSEPEFGAMVVYLAETCSSFGIWGQNLSNEEAQNRFTARATAAMAAVESSAVEAEFMAGAVLGNNPHLADGNGTINTTATSVSNAIAYLENQIAETGRRGVIHMSPAAATKATVDRLLFVDGQILHTILGTPIVPGYGYVGNSRPAGGAPAPTAVQEYMYATGPIEVRRSTMFVLPETVSQALDRRTNTITYRAERYYTVDWDTELQVAVLTDRSI